MVELNDDVRGKIAEALQYKPRVTPPALLRRQVHDFWENSKDISDCLLKFDA